MQVGYGFLIYNCVGNCSFGREEFSDIWRSVKPYFGFVEKRDFEAVNGVLIMQPLFHMGVAPRLQKNYNSIGILIRKDDFSSFSISLVHLKS